MVLSRKLFLKIEIYIIPMRQTLLIIFICLSISAFAQDKTSATLTWFRSANMGVMVHYLNGLQNSKSPWNKEKITSWDKCVNDFNVDKFAKQVNEIGASYVIFTVQQGDRFMCLPNNTFERLTGLKRGKGTSNRDLINDLYVALNRYRIKLFLYVTFDGVTRDHDAAVKLKNPVLNVARNNGKFIMEENWVRIWASVLQDISLRYKSKIAGWWIDGAYPFTGVTDGHIKIVAAALRKGNKDALLAFNPAPRNQVSSYSRWDDYTAGEMNLLNFPPPIDGKINGKQWHTVTYLGRDWSMPGVRFARKEIADFMALCKVRHSNVTLDIYIDRYGVMDHEQFFFLKELNK
jgi:hypothetical protein